MSKVVSLKVRDEVFKETEDMLKTIKIPRNAYINKALEFFNTIQKRRLLRKKLTRESKLVSKESLLVLNEFEDFREGINE